VKRDLFQAGPQGKAIKKKLPSFQNGGWGEETGENDLVLQETGGKKIGRKWLRGTHQIRRPPQGKRWNVFWGEGGAVCVP